MLPLSDHTCAFTARSTFKNPAPCSHGRPLGAFVVLISAVFNASAFQAGDRCARIAAAPATCGAAIDVPDSAV
jgi:hypothetical protein